MRTLAIIPARGGSKRVPGKNIRPFLGTPLIEWSIRFALAIPEFDRIVVSTDDADIAAISQAAGADVPYLRPAELASDTAGSAAVAVELLQRLATTGERYDAVALLQPTSPMRIATRWQSAFEHIAQPDCDAVIGVTPARDHPYHVFAWDGGNRLLPFGGSGSLQLRTQDLPMAVVVAGNLYLIKADVLQNAGTFFPARTRAVLCDEPQEAVDIDSESDWVAAEAIGRLYHQGPVKAHGSP